MAQSAPQLQCFVLKRLASNQTIPASSGAGYSNNIGEYMDAKRLKAGDALLAAANEFWQACRDEGQYGAIQWLESSAGELIIFTRGEYRQHLLQNIHTMPSDKVHFFKGEVMPSDEEEE